MKQLINSCRFIAYILFISFLSENCSSFLEIKSGSYQPTLNKSQFNEIILFCGNPGVGKSSLCNSIFQKLVFGSGISLGEGMTNHKQEHLHENKLYIDTPGLDDVRLRQHAAEEITKSLKHNNNYKIVFVATLESGRIKPADLATINVTCDAINADFEYGIVFNKVTKGVIDKINKTSVEDEPLLPKYLMALHKKPSSVVILKRVEDLEDQDSVYLPESHENRQKLLSFIGGLKANRIKKEEIQQIDIIDFDKKIEAIEKMFKGVINRLNSELEEQRKTIENLRNKSSCIIL